MAMNGNRPEPVGISVAAPRFDQLFMGAAALGLDRTL
jgi:hypothetical protein